MKTALVHDWFYSLSGAEKVAEAIYQLFPSEVYTLIKNEKKLSSLSIPLEKIQSSFIQKLPFAKTKYPYYLPLFPYAIENIDLRHADVILSSSSSVAKNVLTHSGQLHICYCHTPMRALWDLYFETLQERKLGCGPQGLFTKLLFHRLRNWDLLHAQRVDYFVANSRYVARRILKLYNKRAEVIYPPVDIELFHPQTSIKKEDYFITISRCVPYKRIDLLLETMRLLPRKKLFVVGEGPELTALKSKAPSNVTFTGHIPDSSLTSLLQKARAFLYMAIEDFGIAPIEAQAAATPVIAFSKGACSETVLDKKTGLLFHEQTPQALAGALELFEVLEKSFDPKVLIDHSKKFSKQLFCSRFSRFVEEKYTQFLKET